MLGTNDLQLKYNKSSKTIIEDLLWYKKIIKEEYDDIENRKKYFLEETLPKIIYILPINFDFKKNAAVIFDENSEKKRQEIKEYFLKNKMNVINENNMELFEDGLHLNYNDHEKLASIVKEYLENGR